MLELNIIFQLQVHYYREETLSPVIKYYPELTF